MRLPQCSVLRGFHSMLQQAFDAVECLVLSVDPKRACTKYENGWIELASWSSNTVAVAEEKLMRAPNSTSSRQRSAHIWCRTRCVRLFQLHRIVYCVCRGRCGWNVLQILRKAIKMPFGDTCIKTEKKKITGVTFGQTQMPLMI